MKTVLLLAVILFVGALATFDASDEDVIRLSDENFDRILRDNQFVMVIFYAPWCGNCKEIEPHYNDAATALVDTGVKLAILNGQDFPRIAKRYSVTNYPVIKWFRDGQPIDYSGGRTGDAFVTWISKRIGVISTILSEPIDIDFFVEDNRIAVIGFFESTTDPMIRVFENAAAQTEGLAFAQMVNIEAGKKYGLANGTGIVMFRPFDERRVQLQTFTFNSLTSFIDQYRYPLLLTYEQHLVDRIFKSPVGTAVVIFTFTEIRGLHELAKQYEGKAVIATANDTDKRMLDHFGLKTLDFPLVILLNTKDGAKYRLTGKINKQSITNFIESYFEGKVPRYYKSEAIPSTHFGPVLSIVGNSFKRYADGTKHLFLTVFAPWDGHCKMWAPVFEDVANHFSSRKDIIFGKMDGILNEVTGLNIRGFPNIFYFPIGVTDPSAAIPYNGPREYFKLVEFVNAKLGIVEEEEGSKASNDDSKIKDEL